MAVDMKTMRRDIQQRNAALREDLSSWLSHAREIADQLIPRQIPFLQQAGAVRQQPNQGTKRHQHILDATGIRALRVLTSGLVAGMTSQARPWFTLRTPDEKLNDKKNVRVWLHSVERVMRQIFEQSNTYSMFRKAYPQLGAFGTFGNIMLSNFDDVIRHNPMVFGQYAIDVDDEGQPNTMYRQFEMTVDQLVRKFGYKNCSLSVRNMYDNRRLHHWIPVIHGIEPNRERDPLRFDSGNMPFRSVYIEAHGEDDSVLRKSGFRRFPGVFPRWQTHGNDVYGSSPGMEALGHLRSLQHKAVRKAQAIDYKTLPPLQAPTIFRQGGLNIGAGKVTYVDAVGGQNAVKSLFEVNLDLSHLLEDIQDERIQVKQIFYEDLFLMLAGQDLGRDVTAREIAERHEEKLLMLGPVLESLHEELLSPLIEATFQYMIEAGIVPTPPRELAGQGLVVKFVSLLAQAQQLVGLNAVDRLLGTLTSLTEIKPEVWDKIDADEVVNVYSDMLGVDPNLIVADEQVGIIRANRAQQQQLMQAAAVAPEFARAAKDADSVAPDGAVAQALQQLGG